MPMRFVTDQKGATAVEFAFVMPVIITIVFGCIEFGLIFLSYNSAGHASWDTTRQLATGKISIAQVDTTARNQLPSWVRSGATITSAASSSDPNTNRFTVTVSFPASTATPTRLLSWAYGTLTLTSRTTLQQEPS